MVYGIIGENCTGKSTLAEELRRQTGAEIVTGRDYFRMAKSEQEAERLFRKRLLAALDGEELIYVTSELGQCALLPEGAIRIVVSADLETIKERFKARMHGNLPAPVAQMLEKKHGLFDGIECDYTFDGAHGDAAALCRELLRRGNA